MLTKRVSFVAAILIVSAFAVAACGVASSTNSSSATATNAASVNPQSTPGSVTPSGPVPVGSVWTMTVHSAQAYPNGWHAPAGMHGDWGHMGHGYMAVVFDVSAQTSATPVPGMDMAYGGPACALRSGWGMMGSMMGSGAYNWQTMSPGLYRGPIAFMAPTSTRQFTLVCTDPATGQQASWNIGF